MKTAKEMFEELGFKIVKTPYEKLICYMTDDTYFNRKIEVWIDSKIIYNNLVYGDFEMKGSCPLNKELLQAINKQAEELGWLYEERLY